jgi:hypothetical protein
MCKVACKEESFQNEVKDKRKLYASLIADKVFCNFLKWYEEKYTAIWVKKIILFAWHNHVNESS